MLSSMQGINIFPRSSAMPTGIVATLVAYVFNSYSWLFGAFFILNIVDYITGTMKAKYNNELSSVEGSKGIYRKVGYWFVIFIAFFGSISIIEAGHSMHLDLSFVSMFGWFTLATYIINEVRSILENLIVAGVRVPSFLVRGFKVAQDIIDSKIDDAMDAVEDALDLDTDSDNTDNIDSDEIDIKNTDSDDAEISDNNIEELG